MKKSIHTEKCISDFFKFEIEKQSVIFGGGDDDGHDKDIFGMPGDDEDEE